MIGIKPYGQYEPIHGLVLKPYIDLCRMGTGSLVARQLEYGAPMRGAMIQLSKQIRGNTK